MVPASKCIRCGANNAVEFDAWIAHYGEARTWSVKRPVPQSVDCTTVLACDTCVSRTRSIGWFLLILGIGLIPVSLLLCASVVRHDADTPKEEWVRTAPEGHPTVERVETKGYPVTPGMGTNDTLSAIEFFAGLFVCLCGFFCIGHGVIRIRKPLIVLARAADKQGKFHSTCCGIGKPPAWLYGEELATGRVVLILALLVIIAALAALLIRGIWWT